MKRDGIILVAVGIPLLFYLWDGVYGRRHPYRVGQAEACASGSVFSRRQAEIIAYGLDDVRGLAIDDSDALGDYVYIAEAHRPPLIFDTHLDNGHFVGFRGLGRKEFSNQPLCLDGACEDLNNRGLAVNGKEVILAEDGKGKLDRRALSGFELGEEKGWGELDVEMLQAPAGAWGSGATWFVTNDRGREAHEDPFAPEKMGGTLYRVVLGHDGAADSGPTSGSLRDLKDGLQRPSGVVAETPDGPVYVTEDYGDGVRWAIFKKVGEKWLQDGYLASVRKDGQRVPQFLGIAFWPETLEPEERGSQFLVPKRLDTATADEEMLKREAKVIFAAGPRGLYAFDTGGASIGRMAFDEPVSGLTLSKYYLYLVVGNKLCRILLSELTETPSQVKTWNLLRANVGAITTAPPSPAIQPDGGIRERLRMEGKIPLGGASGPHLRRAGKRSTPGLSPQASGERCEIGRAKEEAAMPVSSRVSGAKAGGRKDFASRCCCRGPFREAAHPR